ncbi:MAG: DEAD/DEAH box helicase [Vicinamibacteria bacterium]|jgi:ATP-dependent RNA helicase DeaD|nr:DEAD/DEAH box helicase [Vicinamibacteria bacterium]
MTAASITFRSLLISQPTLDALIQKGYDHPTPCQAETIPPALRGQDLVVQSRTGTGKTAAFGIPLVEKVDLSIKAVQGVVLAPTRELAVQVAEELGAIGKGRGIRVAAIYGGDSMDRQIDLLESGVQLIAGTPGRVLDHLRRGTLDLKNLKIFILDEADRMLDMGFAEEMQKIVAFVPEERQTLLFSATIPASIKHLIYNFLKEPQWLLLSEDKVYVTDVEHVYCIVPRMRKEQTLYDLLLWEEPTSAMVFCNTREETRQVHEFLHKRGLPSEMLSSDLTQGKRERVLKAYREGRIKVLATTDVASRGIDVDDVSHVFIFSTPDSPEQYIHRAGRTGRIGKSGRAISLLSAHDIMNYNRLVKRYHIEVKELRPPSSDDVTRRTAERVLDLILKERDGSPDALALTDVLLARDDRRHLVASLLEVWRDEKRKVVIPIEVDPEEAAAAAADAAADAKDAGSSRPFSGGRGRRPGGGGGGGRGRSGPPRRH